MTGRTSARIYRIWSGEHQAWWRANFCGYTDDPAQVGLYTKAEAASALRTAGREKKLKAVMVEKDWTVVAELGELTDVYIVSAPTRSAARYKLFRQWWFARGDSSAARREGWLRFSSRIIRVGLA